MISSDRSNVVLTGFMGTGKTTVGRLLAELLGFEFVDTDQMIEADHGPIPLIFADQGEAAFRAIEASVAIELAERRGQVIATGGRLLLDETNAGALAVEGRTFCLTAPTAVILERVLGDGTAHRPLLDRDDPSGRIEALLSERATAYGRFEQVETQNRTPHAIADDIARRLTP